MILFILFLSCSQKKNYPTDQEISKKNAQILHEIDSLKKEYRNIENSEHIIQNKIDSINKERKRLKDKSDRDNYLKDSISNPLDYDRIKHNKLTKWLSYYDVRFDNFIFFLNLN